MRADRWRVTSSSGGNTVAAQQSTDRNMLTFNGTAGVPLQWDSGINATQQGYLNAGDSNGKQRLAYLRGDRSNELTSAGVGLFRVRKSVLGDIINSSTAWVGPPNTYAGSGAWTDKLNTAVAMPENAGGGQSYTAFRNLFNNRQKRGLCRLERRPAARVPHRRL